jgi:hypothetical protein
MSTLSLPFAHLNLRRNPFGEASPEERGGLAVVDVERFVPRLANPGFAVEFIGDCGRGKTTRLRALWDRLDRPPFLRVAEEPRGFRAPDASVIFVDEAQFLSARQRRKLFGRRSSFVVGTHVSLAPAFEQAGLCYESAPVGGVDVELVGRIIARRLEWARRDSGPVPGVSKPAIEALIERHGDDLRAIEHHLYEVFQRLEEICDVEMRHLR